MAHANRLPTLTTRRNDMRSLSCGMVAALLLLIGCTKQASGDAPSSAGATTPAVADTPPATDGSCALLSLAEIRRVLPAAARAVHNDSLIKHGIDACGWYGSSKAPVLEVSAWQVSGADDTPMDNARTLAMGIADPTRNDTQGAVRLEKVAGVGEDAVAVVEKADDARGILTTAALLVLQRNGRIATVASGDIAAQDRDKSLKDLATLGKAVASRL
jgi:hypothetical protein